MIITAAVVEEKGGPFVLQPLEIGELRPDEVLVRIAAAGVCHTDIVVRDQWYPVPLPAVLGHEGAGTVEQVGADVGRLVPGDRVSLSFNSCGDCRSCLTGRPSYCADFFGRNFGSSRTDGSSPFSRPADAGGPVHGNYFGQSSFATYAVANERSAVKLDAAIPFEVVAPFGCGIQTGAGSVLTSLRPPAGSSIAIFGAGSVGLAAVMAARIVGCTTIIAVDIRPQRLRIAEELGATHSIDGSTEEAVARIIEITGGGADYSLEATASPVVLRQAVECLAPTGTCGLIGAAAFGTEVSLDMNSILIPGRTLRGLVEGDSIPQLFIPRLVELWKQGRFPVERIVATYDFEAIDQAVRDAETGVVIKPVLRMV
jgi:aryl-alcohol dehydrogenase